MNLRDHMKGHNLKTGLFAATLQLFFAAHALGKRLRGLFSLNPRMRRRSLHYLRVWNTGSPSSIPILHILLHLQDRNVIQDRHLLMRGPQSGQGFLVYY